MAESTIVVLGAGRIGATLGAKWVAAGRDVVFGVTDPQGEKAQALRKQLGGQADIRTTAEALAAGDIILFAVPGGAMEQVIASNAPALAGKLVIDAANRMGAERTDSLVAFRQHAPSVRYVRAFNSLGFENFADPIIGGMQADLFYSSPEGDTAQVEQVIGEVGLRPIRVGGDEQVETVDGVLRLWMALARGGFGRRLAFKTLTPTP